MPRGEKHQYSDEARQNMVKQQVLTNHVSDPVIAQAMELVPRELFVPTELAHLAYIDEEIPITRPGSGPVRYLLEPMTLARMLQLAQIDAECKVLAIACGTGYVTTVLSNIVHKVYGLENDELLAARANNNLQELRVRNVQVAIGALGDGFSSAAPYDAILVCGGIGTVPTPIEHQLKEGGRLVYIENARQHAGLGRIRQGIKHQGVVSYRSFFDASARALPEFSAPEGFVF